MTRTLNITPILVLAVLAFGCKHAVASDAAAAEVDSKSGGDSVPVLVPIVVAAVVVQPSARLVNLVGTLFGNEQVTISSQVEGQIESLGADLGDEVESGQLLARINDDQWVARLREVEATLAKARADEERGRQLSGSKVISTQEYESMKMHVDVASAQRDTMRVSIQHARVVAPLKAAVSRRFVSVGEYVRPGTPLFTLVAQDPLKLRGDVPERFSNELKIGQLVQIRVDSFPTEVFVGKLSRISPASNPENRSVAIEALVDNQARRLKPGFFGNASVVTRSDDRALMVPQEAIVTFAGVTKLFVIADDQAHERNVTLGTRGGSGLVEIIDGVRADEQVAVSGLSKLEEGAAVSIKETRAVNLPQP